MKVLFVSSGKANTKSGLSPIIEAQGEALKSTGISLDYFGIKSYLKDGLRLYKVLRETQYDVIHAHYNLSAFLSTLARTWLLFVLYISTMLTTIFYVE